jgi:nucleolar protein 56
VRVGHKRFEQQGDLAVESADSPLVFSLSISDLARFGKTVKLAGFRPFDSAADALAQCNAVSEGVLTDTLKSFLEQTLPQKKNKFILGVADAKLGAAILETTGIRCECNDRMAEATRGCRLHYERLVAGLRPGDASTAALGLAHAYSRGKVKFNVNRADNMIIQSIAVLDTLDKDINTLVMRVREWYAWHFPELGRIVTDNISYARASLVTQDKAALSEEDLPRLAEALGGDDEKAAAVLAAARASMGQDISPVDVAHIQALAGRVVALAQFRVELTQYLNDKMNAVAPNLGALIGDTVGARLIAHAGSLTNLAKYPASTVQILGAEKALFRALKTKGNTPKYGLIYHSSFIGRAQVRVFFCSALPLSARLSTPALRCCCASQDCANQKQHYERFMTCAAALPHSVGGAAER